MKQRKLRMTIEGKQYEVLVEDITDEEKGGASPYRGLGMGKGAQASPEPSAAPAAAAPRAAAPAAGSAGEEARIAPLSGVVAKILVKEGDAVKTGDKLAEIEAMKQRTAVIAHRTGTVKDILINEGDPIDAGQVMLSIV